MKCAQRFGHSSPKVTAFETILLRPEQVVSDNVGIEELRGAP